MHNFSIFSNCPAPEVYMCSCEEYGVLGYGFAIDWWSLGILAWETLAGIRPYPLHAATSHREALAILQVSLISSLRPRCYALINTRMWNKKPMEDWKRRDFLLSKYIWAIKLILIVFKTVYFGGTKAWD